MSNIIFRILPNIEDISLFDDSFSHKKSDNDKNNNIREETIENMEFIEDSYFTDPIYGARWTNLKTQFAECVSQIQDKPFTTYKIVRMSGRLNNYDFKFIFLNEFKQQICECKIEFKHGSSSIYKLPQFLSLADNFNMLDCDASSYGLYFYEKYLDQYLLLDPSITSPKPDKSVYVKYIGSVSVKPEVSPFFSELKIKESIKKKEKFNLVNESIKEYLQLYAHTINLPKLAEKIRVSQDNKIFMMWHNNKFNIERMMAQTKVNNTLKYIGIKNNNTILVKSENYMYELLLRWRNHKGILNPAWQIKVKQLTMRL